MTSNPRNIGTGGDLFEHLPGLLNYPPQRSLVVAGCRGTSLTTVATIDLTDHDIVKRVRRTGIIGEMLGNDLCDNAKLLFIDSEEDRLALFGHSQLIGLVTVALNQHGIADIESFRTRRIAAGERWVSVGDDDIHGVIGDPTTSFLMAESVTRGERQYLSLEELESEFAPASPPRIAQIAAIEPTLPEHDEIHVAELVESVKTAATQQVPDHQLARAILALRDPRVLADFVAFAVGRPDSAVTEFAQQVAAVSTGNDRANACVVAAANCYIRGEETSTSIALQIALGEAPEHRPAAAMLALYNRNPSSLDWYETFTRPENLLGHPAEQDRR